MGAYGNKRLTEDKVAGGLLVTLRESSKRCDRCDFPLDHSLWKGQRIVYSTNKSVVDGWICVRCALNPPKGSKTSKKPKPKVTIEDIDRYLCKLLGDK